MSEGTYNRPLKGVSSEERNAVVRSDILELVNDGGWDGVNTCAFVRLPQERRTKVAIVAFATGDAVCIFAAMFFILFYGLDPFYR
jgi:hypothetical protein